MENNDFSFSAEKLVKLAHMRMPFGKYKDQYLSELPEPYLVWFKQQGFPKNELGRMLEEVLEIKVNGLEYLLRKIRKEYPAI
ncbi:MAG: DUF3820 family protein [Bacteroidota bacterium]|nr:DUF3820 family protein [Bacteroidota bacterium]